MTDRKLPQAQALRVVNKKVINKQNILRTTSRGCRHVYFGSDTYVGGETGFMLSQPLLVSCVACGVQHNGE